MDYLTSAKSYASTNPKMTMAILAGVVVVILALVNVLSIVGVKPDNITDAATKTKVQNSKRAAIGLIVMSIIAAGAYYYTSKK
jgi:hypothetical protein